MSIYSMAGTEVEQVTLAGNLPYTLPIGLAPNSVHPVVFTQDATGGHTVTFAGQPVVVDLAAGASSTVEFHPVRGGYVALAALDATKIKRFDLTANLTVDTTGWPTDHVVTAIYTQPAVGRPYSVTYAGQTVPVAATGATKVEWTWDGTDWTWRIPGSAANAKTMTGLSVQPAVPAPTFSANLAPDLGGWTLAGGATIAAGTVTIPSGGSLSTTIAATSGKTYQIDVSRSASSGGPMIVSLGAVTIQPESWANSSVTLVASSSGALTLTIGGGTWVATVTGVIVREVTAQASPVLSGGIELRRLNDNVAAGTDSQRSLTTGTNNVAAGADSQRSLTTGNRNVAAGADSQYRPRNVGAWTTTTASGQTSIGHQSGQGSATPSDEITTVGYWAIADGLKATALGARSSAAHAGSVALGSDVTTTSTGQVAVGPRDVEVQDATKGVVLRAPDGGRWRATIGNAGVVTWTKL